MRPLLRLRRLTIRPRLNELIHRHSPLEHHIGHTRLKTGNRTEVDQPFTLARRISDLLDNGRGDLINRLTVLNLHEASRHRVLLAPEEVRVRDRIRHGNTLGGISGGDRGRPGSRSGSTVRSSRRLQARLVAFTRGDRSIRARFDRHGLRRIGRVVVVDDLRLVVLPVAVSVDELRRRDRLFEDHVGLAGLEPLNLAEVEAPGAFTRRGRGARNGRFSDSLNDLTVRDLDESAGHGVLLVGLQVLVSDRVDDLDARGGLLSRYDRRAFGGRRCALGGDRGRHLGCARVELLDGHGLRLVLRILMGGVLRGIAGAVFVRVDEHVHGLRRFENDVGFAGLEAGHVTEIEFPVARTGIGCRELRGLHREGLRIRSDLAFDDLEEPTGDDVVLAGDQVLVGDRVDDLDARHRIIRGDACGSILLRSRSTGLDGGAELRRLVVAVNRTRVDIVGDDHLGAVFGDLDVPIRFDVRNLDCAVRLDREVEVRDDLVTARGGFFMEGVRARLELEILRLVARSPLGDLLIALLDQDLGAGDLRSAKVDLREADVALVHGRGEGLGVVARVLVLDDVRYEVAVLVVDELQLRGRLLIDHVGLARLNRDTAEIEVPGARTGLVRRDSGGLRGDRLVGVDALLAVGADRHLVEPALELVLHAGQHETADRRERQVLVLDRVDDRDRGRAFLEDDGSGIVRRARDLVRLDRRLQLAIVLDGRVDDLDPGQITGHGLVDRLRELDALVVHREFVKDAVSACRRGLRETCGRDLLDQAVAAIGEAELHLIGSRGGVPFVDLHPFLALLHLDDESSADEQVALIAVLVEAHLVLVAGDFDHDALRGRFRISVCRHGRRALIDRHGGAVGPIADVRLAVDPLVHGEGGRGIHIHLSLRNRDLDGRRAVRLIRIHREHDECVAGSGFGTGVVLHEGRDRHIVVRLEAHVVDAVIDGQGVRSLDEFRSGVVVALRVGISLLPHGGGLRSGLVGVVHRHQGSGGGHAPLRGKTADRAVRVHRELDRTRADVSGGGLRLGQTVFAGHDLEGGRSVVLRLEGLLEVA